MSSTDALEALYVSTSGDYWKSNRNWMSGDPCSDSWEGVTCSGSTVSSISLQDNGLVGTLPVELGLLSTVTAGLDLSGNDGITGALPSELGTLTGLTTTFNLGRCALRRVLTSLLH